MADLLGTVVKIVELAWSIKKAVETVRHNKEECRDIEKRVGRVSGIIRNLQEEVVETMSNNVTSGALEDLAEALDRALKLVTYCQHKSRVRRFIAPGGMAEKLRRAQTDISHAMMTIVFALNVRGTIIWENCVPHRPAQQDYEVQSVALPIIEYGEDEKEDYSVRGLTTREMKNAMTTENGELLNAADHGSTVFVEPSKVTDQVTEVSTQDEVTHIGNGSHSTTIHEIFGSTPNVSGALHISTGSTNTTEVNETEAGKDQNDAKGKVIVEEYDLQKILDEQDTHDLYCPNCKSCITRRVILKKRKRTSRQARRDESPERAQLVEPCASVFAEGEPDVFGCLSCFAFFIPSGCGFNIFRIFERRDVNQEVQVQHAYASQETSGNLGSWLLSYFQSVGSPKLSANAGSLKEPLLSGSHNTNDKTSSVEDSASSSHSHATVGEAEQLNKPLLDGFHFPAGRNKEEIKQAFSEFHGTASSSVTVHTSSSSQSETGLFIQTEEVYEVACPQLPREHQDPQPCKFKESCWVIVEVLLGVLLGNETPPASTSISVLSAAAAATTHFKRFSLSELEDATHNFLEDNIIGRGAFATVYKGVLDDGPVVAIKKIQCSYKLSKHICDILSHVSKLEHKNIVRLLGHGYRVAERAAGLQDEKDSSGKDDLFLVEEYMPNGSLDRIIYGSQLDWSSRLSLIQRIAHGLHYLHEQQIIHLDLKPNNILIDYEMNPKITDFGRARMLDQGDDVTTRDTDYLLAGTMGYMPPEYIMEGVVSKMYDVYSFGVTLLEIISSMCSSVPVHRQASIEWAWAAREAGQMELLDLSLCFETQLNEARRCLEIGLLCTQSDRADRPTMVDVVEMLDSKKELPTPKQPKYTKGRSSS